MRVTVRQRRRLTCHKPLVNTVTQQTMQRSSSRGNVSQDDEEILDVINLEETQQEEGDDGVFSQDIEICWSSKSMKKNELSTASSTVVSGDVSEAHRLDDDTVSDYYPTCTSSMEKEGPKGFIKHRHGFGIY